MSTAQELLRDLRRKGAELSIQNGLLRYRAPLGVLSPSDIDNLRLKKNEIIAWLRSEASDSSISNVCDDGSVRVLACSFAQQRLWFISQLEGGDVAYHMSSAYRILGSLNAEAMQLAFAGVIARHEALRTVFKNVDGIPMQVISPRDEIKLRQVDFSSRPSDERDVDAMGLLDAELNQSFEISEGPLIRGLLVKLAEDHHILSITMHHIVSDGWSIGIFFSELGQLYAAYRDDLPNPLPDLPTQYGDYAVWQRQWLQGDVLQRQLDYWKQQLAGAKPVELPLDHVRPQVRSFEGAEHGVHISAELTAKLRGIARRNEATMFMTVFGAFQLLLWRFSRQTDLVVVSPIAGRSLAETESLIGFFVNVVVLRVRLDGRQSFTELLASVKEICVAAFEHDDLPFEKLMAELHGERKSLATVLARVSFTLLYGSDGRINFGGLNATHVPQPATTAKNDLQLTVHESQDGLYCRFVYAKDLFEKQTIEALAQRFVRLVQQIVDAPEKWIQQYDLTLSNPVSDHSTWFRLSRAQEAAFDRSRLNSKSALVGIVECAELLERVDPTLFERAVQTIVDATSALRLRFEVDARGLVRQQIRQSRKIQVHLVDFSHTDEPELAAEHWVQQQLLTKVPLQHDPLLEHALLKLSESQFLWCRQCHPLMVDSASLRVQRARVLQIYRGIVDGVAQSHVRDDEEYFHYLHLEREYLFSSQYWADSDYWRAAREKEKSSQDPSFDNTRADLSELLSAHLDIHPQLTASLSECATKCGMTLGRFITAATILFLQKTTDQNQLVGIWTDMCFAGATHDGLAPNSNLLRMRFELKSHAAIGELLLSIDQQVRSAFTHRSFDGVDTGRAGNDRAETPLWRVRIDDSVDSAQQLDMLKNVRTFPYQLMGIMISVSCLAQHNHLLAQIDTNTRRCESWELELYLSRFHRFLSNLGQWIASKTSFHAVPRLSAEERLLAVSAFNGTQALYPRALLIHQLFEDQVCRNPHGIAVCGENEKITYAELNQRANQLAHYLRTRDVGPNRLVALCVERSIELVIGLLGILKSGGAYVPLNPVDPEERLEYLVKDASPWLLLSQRHLKARLPQNVAQVVALDADWNQIARHSSTNLCAKELGLNSNHLSYVIYTSGSTGAPKGVMVSHGNVVNHNIAVVNEFSLESTDRVLQFATFCFDASVEEIFPTLNSGATLVLRSEQTPTPEEFTTQILRDSISVLNLPTAYWQLWITTLDPEFFTRSKLRLVVVGGEKVSAAALNRWKSSAADHVKWINTYGPTEATISCTSYAADFRAELKEVPIGRPMANIRIYIVDKELEPVPIGMVGEICIGGAGVARGYLRRPALTADRFVPDPFGSPGERIYRTGDLGRWRADGTIEYVGRNDHQIKLRGHRIELGEIESKLQQLDDVTQAVVTVRVKDDSAHSLVAYVTTKNNAEIKPEAFRQGLIAKLPEYMIPAAFIVVENFPLTVNGKVDRARLPEPNLQDELGGKYLRPQGTMECALARIWEELLSIPRVGRRDNFFELGGHSLIAVQVLSRIRKSMGRELPLVELLQHLTIESLAARLATIPVTELPKIARADRSTDSPCSFAQQRLWFACQLDESEAAYDIPVAIRMRGVLDSTSLKKAFGTVLCRHDVLRAVFKSVDGDPIQVICAPELFELKCVSLQEYEVSRRRAAIEQLISQELKERFNLAAGPLVRGLLVKETEVENLLLIRMHHIVADGWSFGIFLRELSTLYSAFRAEMPNPLPDVTIQYSDYAVWQRDWMQGEVLQSHLRYWKDQLKGASVLELPFDRPRSAIRSYRGAQCSVLIPKELSNRLTVIANEAGATIYMALLALYQILLWRVSDQDDVVVASATAGRTRHETEDMIGPFVNMLLMRSRVNGSLRFREFLALVKSVALSAYQHEELPFDKLIAELQAERPGSAAALARIAFTWQNLPEGEFELSGLKLEQALQSDALDVAAKADLLLMGRERSDGIHAQFQYAADLFERSTIERLIARLSRLVEVVVSQPDIRLDEIDLSLPMPDDISQLEIHRPSSNQQIMWVDLQVHPEKTSYYNIVEFLEITGFIDPQLFTEALLRVVNSTTAFKTDFHLDSTGLLKQEILAARQISVPMLDLSAEANPQAAAHAWMEAQRLRHIDPTAEVPFRFTLLKLSSERFYWFAHYHHLMIDGVGQVLFRDRVARCYREMLAGKAPEIISDEPSFLQHWYSDREYRYTKNYLLDRGYWIENSSLGKAITLSVKSTIADTGEPIRIRLPLPSILSHSLRRSSLATGVTFQRFITAMSVLYLHKMSGQEQLCIGLPTHGRFEKSSRDLIAARTNICPIQFDIDPDATLQDFIAAFTARLRGSLEHGRLGYEEIRRLSKTQSAEARLFRVTVNVLPNHLQQLDLTTALGSMRWFPRYEQDLIIWIFLASDREDIVIQLDGNPRLYERWELESHLSRFVSFLDYVVKLDTGIRIKDISVLGNEERQLLLERFNETDLQDGSEKGVLDSIEEQAKNNPNAIAVVFGSERLTYGELNGQANRVAHYLREQGIQTDSRVAICLDRRPEMVVGVLGVLKAGAAYVPMDPAYPMSRLNYMVEDVAASIVLTQEKYETLFTTLCTRIVLLDGKWTSFTKCSDRNFRTDEVGVDRHHLAYVIFTSGSTGNPKAAGVHRSGMDNLLHWYTKKFCFSSRDRILIVSSFSFDLTQKNFLAALMTGGEVHLAHEPFEPRKIAEQIGAAGITTINLTPSAFYAILDSNSEDPARWSDLRCIFLGGEPIQIERVKRLLHSYPELHVINSYGPTECSDVVAFYHVPTASSLAESTTIPIGRPISNTQIYILDNHGSPVPVGVVGEIHIGGAGVGRGYLNKPELTAERFIKDPFSRDPQAKMYKTGDLGRWRSDGNIEYFGRNDHQVKIRGYRVELGEIELQLSRHEQVNEALVVFREDELGEKRLIAYFTSLGDLIPSAEELRAHLKIRLPEHMVPSAYVHLQVMPLTPNGKVDRNGLPAPDTGAYAAKVYESPKGEIEEMLAQIWRELLKVERIGRHDNFFELGGHSLLAMRLVNRIQQLFEIEMALPELFVSPQLSALAEKVLTLQLGQYDSEDLRKIAETMNKEE